VPGAKVPAGAAFALMGVGWPKGPRGAACGLKAAMVGGGRLSMLSAALLHSDNQGGYVDQGGHLV
jgi:hypothetical protein